MISPSKPSYRDFEDALIKALGVREQNLSELVLTLKAGEPPTVRVTFLVPDWSQRQHGDTIIFGGELGRMIERSYRLERIGHDDDYKGPSRSDADPRADAPRDGDGTTGPVPGPAGQG